MTTIGYARVSRHKQDLDLQLDALLKAGCLEKDIYKEKESSMNDDREELAKALAYLRPGDVLAVWRLDRLGRSLQHLITTVQGLQTKGIGFVSLTESIDTTSPSGRLVFHIFAALAEFEHDLIVERVNAGLTAARARGRIGGRPGLQHDDKKVVLARRLYADKSNSIDDICGLLHISRPTFYRYLKMAG
jgi:DNA invertase Pin-like site-specific DNA recombinase